MLLTESHGLGPVLLGRVADRIDGAGLGSLLNPPKILEPLGCAVSNIGALVIPRLRSSVAGSESGGTGVESSATKRVVGVLPLTAVELMARVWGCT